MKRIKERIKTNRRIYKLIAILYVPMLIGLFVMLGLGFAGMSSSVIESKILDILFVVFSIVIHSIIMSLIVLQVNIDEARKSSSGPIFWKVVLYQIRSFFVFMLIATVICLLLWIIFSFESLIKTTLIKRYGSGDGLVYGF